MQQVQKARNRLNSQAQWIQLGLLGASILAPLVNRWNELRAMERTRALREDIEEGLQGIRASTPWNRHTSGRPLQDVNQETSAVSTERHRAPRSGTILWVVGVGVGIIAAGIGTYILVKHRMESYQEEPLLPLPFHKPDSEDPSNLAVPSDQSHGGITKSTDGPRTELWSSTDSAPYNHETVAKLARERPASPSMADFEPAAAIVGNIRTMAYHLAGDNNLPDEDNRIYFSSEEEARLAGYHLHSQ
ncbi:MAG: hypothetical protein ACLQUY_20805 [Ktedonobacterales bacterium]